MRRPWAASAVLRHRGVLLGPLAAFVLAAPVLFLSAFVVGAVGSDVAERSATQRLRAVDLAARLVDARLRSAGSDLVSVGSRRSLREALRTRDAAGIAVHLHDLKASADGYTTAVAFDPAGRLLTADPFVAEAVGRDFSARDYYIGAMATREPFTSEAFATAPGSPGPVAVAVALALREGDQVLGLILVGLAPQLVLASLDPLEKTAGREILIVDKARRVVSSSEPSRAPLTVVDLPGADLADGGTRGVTRLGEGPDARVATYSRIPQAAWTLFVIDDPAVLLEVERRLEDDIGRVATVALAAAALAGAIFSVLYLVLRRQRDELLRSRTELAAATAAADLANQQKSAFLANMSHELRTPLNAVLGFSDLLGEQLDPVMNDRQRRHLRNIKEAGHHLLGLINDVLDLAKVEAGRVELRPEISSVGAITAPVVDTAETLARARGLRFVAHVDATPQLFADVGRLRQILLNLLSNAVKFTNEGGTVTLGVRADGERLQIEVADTGIGIPAAKRDRVFGTFERLHEGTSVAAGTGLGLALTRRLVELHGGTITFESTAGVGTTFRVVLPGLIAAVAGPGRLLVVEDERGDAELMVALAAVHGLRAEVVPTAAAAMASLHAGVPVGVILDLRLPDGRGEDVLRAMKDVPATSAIPVIVVTVEDDEGASRLLGADDHLTKPIDRERLTAWLRRVARRAAAGEVPDAAATG